MARTFTIPSRLFTAGSTVRQIDSLPVDVNKIRVTFTREFWPGTPAETVAIVTVLWNDGSGGRWGLPGGVINGKDGQPLLQSAVEIDVPQVPGPDGRPTKKKNMVGGTVIFDVLQPLRTAISCEAS